MNHAHDRSTGISGSHSFLPDQGSTWVGSASVGWCECWLVMKVVMCGCRRCTGDGIPWDGTKKKETRAGPASVRKCAERLKRQVTLPSPSTHRWACCVMTLPATAKIDPSFLAKAISPCQASPSPLVRRACRPPLLFPPSFQVPSTRPKNGRGSFCHIKFQSSLFTLGILDSFLFAKYHHDWLFALPGTNFIDESICYT